VLADSIRIFEDSALVASHVPLEGRGEKRLDPTHRKIPALPRRRPDEASPPLVLRAGDRVAPGMKPSGGGAAANETAREARSVLLEPE